MKNNTQKKKLIKFSLLAAATTYYPIIDKALTPFLNQNPFWSVTWMAAVGLYNLYLFVEQGKLNEVLEFIQENPDKFVEKLVKTDYFRSNFLKFLGDYLKQQNYQKRQILKKILLGNLSENEKNKYEIDRLNNVLSQISIDAIGNLIWISKEIFPKVNEDVEKEYSEYTKDDDKREQKRLRDITKARKNISSYVQNWLYTNFNPNSEKVKNEHNFSENWSQEEKNKFNRECWIKEHEASEEKNAHWAEYVSLGIMSSITEDAGIGGGASTVYKPTNFGEAFIKYLSGEY